MQFWPGLETRFLRRIALVLALVSAFAIAPVSGHESHDHGKSVTVAPTKAAPRLVLSSERYELVGILTDGELAVYLDRAHNNEPVTTAKVTLAFGDTVLEARPDAKGIYRIEGAPLREHKSHEVIATITDSADDDLLIGTFDLTSLGQRNDEPATSVAHFSAIGGWSFALIVFAAGLLLGLSFRRIPVVAAAIALLLSLFDAPDVFAHGGEDHSHGPPAPLSRLDTPQRRDDGSLIIPKPTQRLLSIRTMLTRHETVRPATRFIGRVIPNPSRSGYVQSINGGRIGLVGAALPKLGQTVKAGDVFAEVEPPITTGDYSTLSEKAGDLEQQIALAEAKLRRYTPLAPAGAVSLGQFEDANAELEGLKRRKATLLATKREREVLRAPVDGVVTLVRVAPGQVVEPREVLFQIIDPASLWVEALAFDPRSTENFGSAYAVLESGDRLALTFQGKGRSLQQHASLLEFAIAVAPTANLSVGLPVTVLAERGDSVTGIVLPKAAVVRGVNGESVVFVHSAPEIFVSRIVKVESIDGDRVLTEGLEPGMRVVVTGTELLAQVR